MRLILTTFLRPLKTGNSHTFMISKNLHLQKGSSELIGMGEVVKINDIIRRTNKNTTDYNIKDFTFQLNSIS